MTRPTSVSSPPGTDMRSQSNHTEPCFSSCGLWLTTTLTVSDSAWPFCGPTAKYRRTLLSIALKANYMVSPRLYWQLLALERSCPVTTLSDVCAVLLMLLFVTLRLSSEVKFIGPTYKVPKWFRRSSLVHKNKCLFFWKHRWLYNPCLLHIKVILLLQFFPLIHPFIPYKSH